MEGYENLVFNGDSLAPRKKSISALILVVVIIFSIIFGAAGGIGGVWYATKHGYLNMGGNNVTTVEKVTVEEESAITDAVKKVSPSVVSILTTRNVQDYFFGETLQQKGGGTGFVVTADGLIMTNKHVASMADKLTVLTSDGKSYDAKTVALDPTNDIALIKIDAKDLPVVELGDSDSLEVGQSVIAIGNALGEYQNTVTTGVISSRSRSITAGDSTGSGSRLEGVIQTDAAINPGNSGGPLVNIKGQVVGINTALDQQGQSIGFSIPINIAKSALQSYLSKGKIVRPMIGIRYVALTKDIATLNKLDVSAGALVIAGQTAGELAVIPGGPADKAGIVENDIITAINDEKIDENTGLATLLNKYQPGDEVELTVLHKGKEAKVKVTLGETSSDSSSQ